MKQVYINNEGYLASIYIKDANISIDVTDELFDQLSICPLDHNWKYVSGNFILVSFYDDNSLKERRYNECFIIIDNRSPMWYNRLTNEQKQELEEWYQAWLDVTKTKIIPIKPDWL